ncbi:MAG: hypothetical protein GF344_14090 [Chitinivibrionales bacterium]|nr:hypothetical protein [Chitinivibrionales bacterium]MBD3357856.1 hypothetical protein [Chitinivibrionales bacterium]
MVPTTGTDVAVMIRVDLPEESHVSGATYSIIGPNLRSNPGGLWSARVEGAASGRAWEPPSETFPIILSAQPGASATDAELRVERDDNSTVFGSLVQILDVENA